jgi:hypothetical protein
MHLSVNNLHFDVDSRDQLQLALARFIQEEFREIWLGFPEFPALSALLNEDRALLMYLREVGDAGFTSRNPAYRGDEGEVIQYKLSNGQIDEYPASWALQESEILEALATMMALEDQLYPTSWHERNRRRCLRRRSRPLYEEQRPHSRALSF